MKLEPGQMLLHYRLAEKIGAGGMGVVWKATDTTLGREVAVKILPDLFSEDPERLVRFEREARLLASLNHPGIASIYGLHEAEGTRFLAMELVPGEDLSQRIGRGALPPEEALEIARQMAEALEAAHENGIVHRDLKPANVKISTDGTVKILDFGLAKALAPETEPADASLSPTITQKATRAGVIMGTAAYMSPEQARGRPVDRRADIWAFGVILFEMLTGRMLFPGETISDIIAAVLRAEPDWKGLPPVTPARIRELLRRCLTRDPKARQRDIGDARIVIQEILAGQGEEPSAALPLQPRRRRAPAILWMAGIVAAALAGAAVSRLLAPEPDRTPIKMLIHAEVTDARARSFVISPDGRALVMTSPEGLRVRWMDEVNPSLLAGTQGAAIPFWSPDSRQIGYELGGRLWRIGVGGGNPVLVCQLAGPMIGGAWRDDGTIVFPLSRGPLIQVSAQGGDPAVLLALAGDEVDFHEPWLLPDGKSLVFSVHRKTAVDRIILFDGVNRKVLIEATPDSSRAVQLLNSPAYAPSGHLVFRKDQGVAGVWAVPFDPAAAEIRGAPFLVAQDGAAPSVSRTGVLAYLDTPEGGPLVMTWLDRAGKELGTLGEPVVGAVDIELSPDGRRAALVILEGGSSDIWVVDLESGIRSRLTFTPENETSPRWSPDGHWIAYNCVAGDEAGGICRSAADGSGKREVIAESGTGPVWLPGGKSILYAPSGGDRRGLLRLNLEEGAAPEIAYESTPWTIWETRVSPDGRHVLYRGDEGGRLMLRIAPLDGGEGRWEVYDGDPLAWPSPGTEILYSEIFERGIVDSVPVQTEPTFALGRPERLFEVGTPLNNISVSADGQRFLVLLPAEPSRREPGIMLIHNWAAGLEEDSP